MLKKSDGCRNVYPGRERVRSLGFPYHGWMVYYNVAAVWKSFFHFQVFLKEKSDLSSALEIIQAWATRKQFRHQAQEKVSRLWIPRRNGHLNSREPLLTLWCLPAPFVGTWESFSLRQICLSGTVKRDLNYLKQLEDLLRKPNSKS